MELLTYSTILFDHYRTRKEETTNTMANLRGHESPAPAPVFNTTLKRDCISQIMTYDIIARTTVLSWKHLAVTYSQTLAQGNKSSLYQASSKLPSETTTSITIPTSITITTIKDY